MPKKNWMLVPVWFRFSQASSTRGLQSLGESINIWQNHVAKALILCKNIDGRKTFE